MHRKLAIICFLVLGIFSGCKKEMPAGGDLVPERLISFSPSGRQIVFEAQKGWYALYDMDTLKNNPLAEGSGQERGNVVWLENGGVAVELDEGVAIKNSDEKTAKMFKTEPGIWYAVRPNGELLVIEEYGETQKLFLLDPKIRKRRAVHIEWREEVPKKLTRIAWADTGEKFAAVGDSDLVLAVMVLEKGNDVFAGGSHLTRIADAQCKLSWGIGGTRINISCQGEKEAAFDLLIGELVGKKESPFPEGSLVAPDNVRVAVIENGRIVVKHKSEF